MFKCTYSEIVWLGLKHQGIQRAPMDWNQELRCAIDHDRGRHNKAEVYRMVLVACIYHIWNEMNNKGFQQKAKHPTLLTRPIIQKVFYRGKLRPRLAQRLDHLNYYP